MNTYESPYTIEEIIQQTCNKCNHQICCRGIFYIVIHKFDDQELLKNAYKRKNDGVYILKKRKNGNCINLDINGKCRVWDIRPRDCQNYFCRRLKDE